MKLGRDTGSLMNHLMADGSALALKPEVGMGATVLMWSDRHAGTIVKVTPRTITVQRDFARRTDSNGMSEVQRYEYSQNPQGLVEVFRLTKRGWRNRCGNGLQIGIRSQYHDYSF